jgi:hypothetical protein
MHTLTDVRYLLNIMILVLRHYRRDNTQTHRDYRCDVRESGVFVRQGDRLAGIESVKSVVYKDREPSCAIKNRETGMYLSAKLVRIW